MAIWVPNPQINFTADTNVTARQWIGPDKFSRGTGKARVYFNIDKNRSVAVPPITVTIHDINTSTSWMSQPGATNIFIGAPVDSNFTFYYGRLHIPDQTINGNSGTIKVYYEVYLPQGATDPASLRGPMSVDSIDWYVNSLHNAPTFGTILTPPGALIDGQRIRLDALGALAAGIQSLQVSYTGTIFPYARTIGLQVNPWLLYDPYDPNVDKAYGRIVFTQPGGWLGTSDNRDFSQDSEITPAKNENKRILW